MKRHCVLGDVDRDVQRRQRGPIVRRLDPVIHHETATITPMALNTPVSIVHIRICIFRFDQVPMARAHGYNRFNRGNVSKKKGFVVNEWKEHVQSRTLMLPTQPQA